MSGGRQREKRGPESRAWDKLKGGPVQIVFRGGGESVKRKLLWVDRYSIGVDRYSFGVGESESPAGDEEILLKHDLRSIKKG